MAWDRTKWNQFVTDNTVIPPTDAPIKTAEEEAIANAAFYEEDIDTTALGVERVKKMLIQLAGETPGTTGQTGDPAPNLANLLTLAASAKRTYTVAATETILTYNIAPNELDGTKDIFNITAFTNNVEDILVKIGTHTLFTYNPSAGFNPGDGHNVIWIAQARNSGDTGEIRSIGRSVGRNSGVSYQNTSVRTNWMSAGGTVRVQVSPLNSALPFSAYVAMYELVFPRLISE